MDVAARWTNYPTEYFNPYHDILSDDGYYTPEIETRRGLYDLVFTFGWRF